MNLKKAEPFRRQVNKSHYFNLQYDSKQRWISYWYQISEVLNSKPKKVLEIGIGNKVVSDYLRKIGIKVTTCDFDKSLKPNIVADIRNLPFNTNNFDTILCAEVLEHIPFSDFEKAIGEIRRVTKKWAVITLPHFSITDIYLGVKIIPFIPKREFSIKVGLPIEHKFLGEHYWEIGKKNYSLSIVKNKIKKSGFKIFKAYYPKENPSHQFFIIKK